jgi:hypothetical protein
VERRARAGPGPLFARECGRQPRYIDLGAAAGWELTVNQPPHGFAGSSPASPTSLRTLHNCGLGSFPSQQSVSNPNFPVCSGLIFVCVASDSLDDKPVRRLGRRLVIPLIADRAGRSRRAAAAGPRTVPRALRMGLADPAAIVASRIVLHLAAHIWPLGPKSPKLGVHAVIEPDVKRSTGRFRPFPPEFGSGGGRPFPNPKL